MKDLILSDDSRFDRLVDGELSEEQRRNMLAGLDREPGGWRRCALAFLEAQCWKDSFRDWATDRVAAAGSPTPPKVLSVLRPKSHWLARVRTGMAMAACFMAALLIGSFLPLGRHVPTTSPAAPDTTNQVASLRDGGPTVADSTGGDTRDVQSETAPGGAWRLVTLSPSDGRHGDAAVQVPAVERSNIDEAWRRSVPAAIPDDVLQALRRTGHEVQQRREFVPVPMNDGRMLVVPVDQVDVHSEGNPAY
jgi:hypothetical protein